MTRPWLEMRAAVALLSLAAVFAFGTGAATAMHLPMEALVCYEWVVFLYLVGCSAWCRYEELQSGPVARLVSTRLDMLEVR